MLPELINEKFEYEFSQLWVGMLGEIVSYSKSSATAEVQPLVKVKNKDEFARLPIIKCPVNIQVGNDIALIPDFKKGDIVDLKGNIYPVDMQLKGQIELAGAFRFMLSNCSIIGAHLKKPKVISPKVLKDGLVIAEINGNMFVQFSESEINLAIGSSTSIKIKKDEVTIKSKKIIINGDLEVTGKSNFKKDVTVDTEVIVGPTKVKSSKHGHTTVLGPTIPPVIPELG